MENYEFYIHDTYIGESGASGGTWDFLMTASGWSTSKTLVDVVNDIWNVAANAVTIIKEAVTEVVNAVKSGFDYIQNTIIGTIISQIVTQAKNMLHVAADLLNQILGMQITKLIDGISINGNTILIYTQGLDLNVQLGNMLFTMENVLSSNIVFETLSVENSLLASALLRAGINLIGWSGLLPPTSQYFLPAHFAHIIAQIFLFEIISYYVDQEPNKEGLAKVYYLIAALGAIGSGLKNIGRATSVEFRSFPSNLFTKIGATRPPSTPISQFLRGIGTMIGISGMLVLIGGIDDDKSILTNAAIIINVLVTLMNLIPPHSLEMSGHPQRSSYKYEFQLLRAVPQLILGLLFFLMFVTL